MKHICGTSAALLLLCSQAFAVTSYQVTGPVLEVSDSKIVVQKENEKWEIARDAATAVQGGDIQVGSKVTIKYTMSAKSVEVKADATPAAKDAKKK